MKKGEVVHHLNEAMKAERALAHYYENAREEARNEEIKRVFAILHERHHAHTELLHAERERVQHLEGEGFFGELFESIGRAISDAVAGLPVMGIEEATHPTFDTLRRFENKLLEHYQEMLPLVDEPGREFLERSMEQCRGYITTLDQLDPLRQARTE